MRAAAVGTKWLVRSVPVQQVRCGELLLALEAPFAHLVSQSLEVLSGAVLDVKLSPP